MREKVPDLNPKEAPPKARARIWICCRAQVTHHGYPQECTWSCWLPSPMRPLPTYALPHTNTPSGGTPPQNVTKFIEAEASYCTFEGSAAPIVPRCGRPATHPVCPRDALEGKGPQRWPQRRLDGRLEEMAKRLGAVTVGYKCR